MALLQTATVQAEEEAEVHVIHWKYFGLFNTLVYQLFVNDLFLYIYFLYPQKIGHYSSLCATLCLFETLTRMYLNQ
jgi:hypothetical protein